MFVSALSTIAGPKSCLISFATRRSHGRNYDTELQRCRLEAALVDFGDYHPLKPIMVSVLSCISIRFNSLKTCKNIVVVFLMGLWQVWPSLNPSRWPIQRPAVGPAKAAPLPLHPPLPQHRQTLWALCWTGPTPCPCLPRPRPARRHPCPTAAPQESVTWTNVNSEACAHLKVKLNKDVLSGPGEEEEREGRRGSGTRFWTLVTEARGNPGQVHHHRKTLHSESSIVAARLFLCLPLTQGPAVS